MHVYLRVYVPSRVSTCSAVTLTATHLYASSTQFISYSAYLGIRRVPSLTIERISRIRVFLRAAEVPVASYDSLNDVVRSEVDEQNTDRDKRA